MADLTTTHHLMLGMLSTRDRSAYDLAEQVGRGLTDVWSRADRQRYDAPKRLVAMGLCTSTTESYGKRTRTVYAITDDGRAALAEWLSEPPRPLTMEFEGMVRLLLATEGTIDDLRRSLAAIAQQAREGIDRYRAMAELMRTDGGTFPERRHAGALANRFMLGHFTHLLEWATWAEGEVATWPDTTSPAATHRSRTEALLAEGAVWGGGAPPA